MKLISSHYKLQRAAAHLAAPIMRITGFRFSKASRDNRILNAVICRVSANLLAEGIKPDRLKF
ncbi:hypothetical protein [Paraburkholderia xenovorans]|uniref:hypothetical protein n=1 Tax=Paraburkholderia xenovorans TaxID=36873 RepID=UPI0015C56F51|nr:hypothetical protein [Paraburkholderia xenovorans]NPT36229.1 hypothetical protein [Paraburkholderia xenovorans]